MKVKGNHPLAELLTRKLFGITECPKAEQKRMVNRAIQAAVLWHEAQEAAVKRSQKYIYRTIHGVDKE